MDHDGEGQRCAIKLYPASQQSVEREVHSPHQIWVRLFRRFGASSSCLPLLSRSNWIRAENFCPHFVVCWWQVCIFSPTMCVSAWSFSSFNLVTSIRHRDMLGALHKRVSVAHAGQTFCLLSATALGSLPDKNGKRKKVAKKEEKTLKPILIPMPGIRHALVSLQAGSKKYENWKPETCSTAFFPVCIVPALLLLPAAHSSKRRRTRSIDGLDVALLYIQRRWSIDH